MDRLCHQARLPASPRGFTLIELIVALTAGLFVASAAFLLARNATQFFQHEARIAAAQFGSLLGLSRLQTDLQRASYLSSPNVQRDPLRCGDVTGWPAGLGRLAGVYIEEGGSVAAHEADHTLSEDLNNDLNPDSIVIGGSFSSTEQFAARGIFAGGGGEVTVVLQVNDGPMVRTTTAAAQTGAASLAQIFAPGRLLRIVDDEGRQSYGVITAFTDSGIAPQISLAASPAVPSKATYGVCGYGGMSVGALVNPVSRVRWDLRAVTAAAYPQYAGLHARGRHGSGSSHVGVAEAPRTELVRVELDAVDAELANTLEVVAEYAVDLKFGLTRAVPGTSPVQLERYDIGAPDVYTLAGQVALAGGGSPQQIRAVQVRLTTRGAERDRDVGIDPPAAGGIYRFSLGAGLGYVRVRSLVADVALPNQVGVIW